MAVRQRVSEKRYDVIIMDGDLPDAEIWSVLQSTNFWPWTAITMLLLGFDTPEYRAKARRRGVLYVVVKSDPVETIVQCVERVLNAQRPATAGTRPRNPRSR